MTDAVATSVDGTTREDHGLDFGGSTPSQSSRLQERSTTNGEPRALAGSSDHDIPYPVSRIPAVNVAQVPQRSPLRYPGGKTWLVPHIRAWLSRTRPRMLIEPFAGGAIVSLTAIMEDLAERAILVELDHDVAAFWRAALLHGPSLVARIAEFTPTRELVRDLERGTPEDSVDRGFRTLVLNRTHRAGILAPGSSLNRRGENGKGILSRWYPKSLIARLNAISEHADRIAFHEADSMHVIEPLLRSCGRNAAVFVDPPYTAGGKRAGTRLYVHNDLDHERLFWILAQHEGSVLMTYDYSPEVARLVVRYGFQAVQVRMKNAHHDRVAELVITRERLFA